MPEQLLRLVNAGYVDDSFQVLKDINWEIRSSSLYQIIGANASGKTALLRLIAGIVPLTSGSFYWRGRKLCFRSQRDATDCGIVYLPEEPLIFHNSSVAENIITVPRVNDGRIAFVSRTRDAEACSALLQQFGLEFTAQTSVDSLSIGEKRIVELLRAYRSGASLVLMDALCGWMSETEYETIIQILVAMREQYDTSAIVCASSVDHILHDADSILYLKFGRQVACLYREKQNINRIPVEFRSEHLEYPKLELKPGETLMELQNFLLPQCGCVSSETFQLQLHEREIVGLYGVDMPRCEAICEVLTGRRQDYEGQLLLNGLPVRLQSPRHALRLGLACQSVNKNEAFFRNLSLHMNLTPPVSDSRNLFACRAEQLNASVRAQRLHLEEKNVAVRCEHLSSGTEQKILISRYLSQKAKIFILFHPTHGMDSKSKLDIYNLLTHLQRSSCGILIFSNDLDELAYMCDRVVVVQKDGIFQITGDSAARAAQLYRYIATYRR